jgi:YbbR domain-containing protein
VRWLGDASSLLLALVLGVMVWLAATQSAEPMRDQELPATGEELIEVELKGLDQGLAAYDVDPRAAAVVLRGVPSELAELDAADIRIHADLSEAVTDSEVISVPLRAECVGCARRAVRIAAVVPPVISARLDEMGGRRVPAQLAGDAGGPDSCREVAATFEPARVTVEGAQARVSEVASVVVDVPTDAADGARVELPVAPVRPVSAGGEPVADVSVFPASVRATIDYVQPETCAQVAVLPVYSDPPEGYYVAGIEVEPDHLQLRADPSRLTGFREEAVVVTELIDISDSRASVRALAQLDLPADVEAVGASEGVTVTILVSPFPGTRSIEVPLEAVGVANGLTVDGLSPSRLQVLVSGPLPELDALDVASLRGTVDVTGLGAGTHRLRPNINLGLGLRVRSVAPAEVDVRLVSGEG